MPRHPRGVTEATAPRWRNITEARATEGLPMDMVLRDADTELRQAPERLTLRLSPEARETLDWLAEARGVSLAEVVRRALGTEKFLVEMSQRRARVLVEVPGERTKELVLV